MKPWPRTGTPPLRVPVRLPLRRNQLPPRLQPQTSLFRNVPPPQPRSRQLLPVPEKLTPPVRPETAGSQMPEDASAVRHRVPWTPRQVVRPPNARPNPSPRPGGSADHQGTCRKGRTAFRRWAADAPAAEADAAQGAGSHLGDAHCAAGRRRCLRWKAARRFVRYRRFIQPWQQVHPWHQLQAGQPSGPAARDSSK